MNPLSYAQPDPGFLAHMFRTMIFGFAIFIGIVIGIILAARFIVLWYLKLDRIERHLSEIAQELKKRSPSPQPPAAP